MPVLELHKHADKSGPAPEEGAAWPLSHVEVKGEVPDVHAFSDGFVRTATDEGWMRFEGEPMAFEVLPDPKGQVTRYLSPLTVTLPGDHLVMSVKRDDEDVDVSYRITAGPVPRGYRVSDDQDPSGFSARHEFAVELEGVN